MDLGKGGEPQRLARSWFHVMDSKGRASYWSEHHIYVDEAGLGARDLQHGSEQRHRIAER